MFTIHRQEHSTCYTCITNELIYDRRLSLQAKGLMILVLSLPNDWEFSARGLAKMCGMTEKTVFRYFGELKALGYLECNKEIDSNGRFTERHYIFHEAPVSPRDTKPPDAKPLVEKPLVEKPLVEKPLVENDRQSNNNINTNNKANKSKKMSAAEKAEEFQRIIGQFNSICISLPKVLSLNPQRYHLLEQAEKQVEDFAELFRRIESSDFLTGRNGKWGGCTFDWLLRPETLTGLLEGKYDNRKPSKKEEERNYAKPVTAAKDDTDDGFLF